MIKNTDGLSNLINFENQKKIFDTTVSEILNIIKEITNIDLESKNIFIKNNILKIKTSSNVRFIILLHINQINQKIKSVNKDFILEL